MTEFTSKYASSIRGTLSGFDRLVFRSLRKISYPFGMLGYLWANQVPLKSFGTQVNEISGRAKEAALRCVEQAGRTLRYLPSSQEDKEAVARSIAREQKITEGPVCALTCVEPCWGFDIYSRREARSGLSKNGLHPFQSIPLGTNNVEEPLRLCHPRLRHEE